MLALLRADASGVVSAPHQRPTCQPLAQLRGERAHAAGLVMYPVMCPPSLSGSNAGHDLEQGHANCVYASHLNDRYKDEAQDNPDQHERRLQRATSAGPFKRNGRLLGATFVARSDVRGGAHMGRPRHPTISRSGWRTALPGFPRLAPAARAPLTPDRDPSRPERRRRSCRCPPRRAAIRAHPPRAPPRRLAPDRCRGSCQV